MRGSDRIFAHALCVLCFICLSGNDLQAQENNEIREPTEAQLEMNAKAIEAVGKKDYAKAIKLFQASIALGELNITYLNMARTYHKMGECSKAKRVYRRTRDVRFKVASPTPDEINEALNTYESQLYKDCPNGELIVSCEPGKMDLFLNDNGPISCPSSEDPLLLKEGEYTIRGEMEGYDSNEIKIKVERVDPTRVALTLARKTETDHAPPRETVIVKPDTDPALEEMRLRMEQEAREKAEKEDRARRAEIERQRKLDEQRVILQSIEEKRVEMELRNTRMRRINYSIAAGLAIGGIVWDTCVFGGGIDGHLKNGTRSSFCSHTYNDTLDIKDAIPVGFYAASFGLWLTTHLIQRGRRKDFELKYQTIKSSADLE